MNNIFWHITAEADILITDGSKPFFKIKSQKVFTITEAQNTSMVSPKANQILQSKSSKS